VEKAIAPVIKLRYEFMTKKKYRAVDDILAGRYNFPTLKNR
jgi:hypothetical protein